MTDHSTDPTRDPLTGGGPPVSYHLVAPGTPVLATGGERIGFVRRTLDHPREGIFDGIVVAIDGMDHFVDAPEVRSCRERAVTLTIGADEAARLPRHTSGPPVGHLTDLDVAPDADDADARRAYRRAMVVRAFARSRTVPVLLVYLIVGWQLPTAFYAGGAVVCIALLVLWAVCRRRIA